jgi:hypothetical protein
MSRPHRHPAVDQVEQSCQGSIEFLDDLRLTVVFQALARKGELGSAVMRENVSFDRH